MSYAQLHELYVIQSLEWGEIAKILNCSKSTIGRALRKHNLLSINYDLTNQKFGKLTVIKKDGRHPLNKRELWLCQCDCGEHHKVLASNLTSNRISSCGCSKIPKGTNKKQFNPYGQITRKKIGKIRSGAKQRGIEFDESIDAKWLWSLFEQQEKKCKLSGLELIFDNDFNKHTASLDRIDSSKGYIKDNVQWIHKDINTIKWDFSQNYFIDLCKKVAKFNG